MPPAAHYCTVHIQLLVILLQKRQMVFSRNFQDVPNIWHPNNHT